MDIDITATTYEDVMAAARSASIESISETKLTLAGAGMMESIGMTEMVAEGYKLAAGSLSELANTLTVALFATRREAGMPDLDWLIAMSGQDLVELGYLTEEEAAAALKSANLTNEESDDND